MNTHKEYSSYNGLDRTVLFFGIPLLWAMLLLVLSVITMFIGMFFFKIVGILFVAVWLPIGIFLRMISQTDDKALDILKLEMKYRMKRKGYDELGQTLSFFPERYLRYKKTIEPYFSNFKEVTNKKPQNDNY